MPQSRTAGKPMNVLGGHEALEPKQSIATEAGRHSRATGGDHAQLDTSMMRVPRRRMHLGRGTGRGGVMHNLDMQIALRAGRRAVLCHKGVIAIGRRMHRTEVAGPADAKQKPQRLAGSLARMIHTAIRRRKG